MNLYDYITRYGHDRYESQLVRDAIPVLESWRPDWRETIDWDQFDITSTRHCILGQLFGGYHRGLTVLFGSDELDTRTDPSRDSNPLVYAFSNPGCRDEWRTQARTKVYA